MPNYSRRHALGAAIAVTTTAGLFVAGTVPATAAPIIVTDLTDPVLDPAGLAQSLAGAGVTISNVAYTGAEAAGGSFSAGTSAIGFEEGVVLSSGDVAAVGTANDGDGYTGYSSQAGDSDLDSLGAGSTQDTTVLEFDVTPDKDTLFFDYVFASEEYNEYVYAGVSDVFGFFVTQPGGTTKQNCAVVADGPDANSDPDPVSIDTINGGNPFGDANASNAGLFRNNDVSDGGGSIEAEPDGFTTILQCVAAVTPGQPNHLKLAISDVGDSILDSWVFLRSGSITTTPEVCGDGIDNDGDGQVDEGCAVPTEESISAGKYYDTNANGEYDPGDDPVADWPIDLGGTTAQTGLTGADGTVEFDVDPGTHTVAEQAAGTPWMQTGNLSDQSTGTAGVTLEDDRTYTVEVDAGESAGALWFGNVCLGADSARSKGFWSNKNGAAAFAADTAGNLALLQGLNLVRESGSAFQPSSYTQYKSWSQAAQSVNASYMLSAQLAAMALSVDASWVDSSALIHAPGAPSANAAGFASVGEVMADADAALGADGFTPAGDPNRALQLTLSDVLDAANNNLSFVQASEVCPAPVFPTP
jgi:hypothetical protein